MAQMTIHNYQAMIMRLEREARENPGGYRFRVFCLVFLAYIYIGIVLAFALALLGAVLFAGYWLVMNAHIIYAAIKILLPVALGVFVFVAAVLRSLWVTIPEPRGRELKREEAVPLFQEMDRLRGLLKVPAFDKVILSDDFNAGIKQVPRLGIFGWQKNILVLGVPLMLTLSPDEFRAVLAHEMGHISGADDSFQHGVYRLNDTWRLLLMGLAAEEHPGIVLFYNFFKWYVPFFYAYTFALQRADEYAADKAAARVIGARQIADALVNLHLTPYRLVPGAGSPDVRTMQIWLNDALSETDSLEDEHPCLANRLRALGQTPRVPEPAEQSAAEKYFGYRLLTLIGSIGITVRPAPMPDEPAPISAPAPTQTMPTLSPQPAVAVARNNPRPQKDEDSSDILRPVGG